MRFKVFRIHTFAITPKLQMLTFLFNDRNISGDEIACA